MKQKPRAYLAGLNLSKAINEMVNLMYQNRTAANFYRGLAEGLKIDVERRKKEALKRVMLPKPEEEEA